MKIEHVAIWTKDLEKMKDFYCKYFKTNHGELYYNKNTGFKSYFLTFSSGARIELMNNEFNKKSGYDQLGYAHIAVSVGIKQDVDNMTDEFKKDGFKVISGPRTTGDGYYESVIEDPEGNLIEITCN
ncbi:VOC family protein [Clostridium intestinale]|uniref:VOC family protein n=1 Tax=Clostridium intestinale TaxID=36845 RepID=UPI0028E9ABCF|nr:VOC family protein [Clostridium intestinale]